MTTIAVPQDCFDRICDKIRQSSQPRTSYQFDGDAFETTVWRDGQKLMAEDPKGIREIIAVHPDEMMNAEVGSLKGLFTQLLLREGFNYNVIISLLCQIKPELVRLDIAARNREDPNIRQEAKRQASHLFKTLVAVCKKHKEGCAGVSLHSENFSAVLPG
jgi:hypothetical protein